MDDRLPMWKPKRGGRRREKRRRETLEQQVKRVVRARCVARDGDCRFRGTPVPLARRVSPGCVDLPEGTSVMVVRFAGRDGKVICADRHVRYRPPAILARPCMIHRKVAASRTHR